MNRQQCRTSAADYICFKASTVITNNYALRFAANTITISDPDTLEWEKNVK